MSDERTTQRRPFGTLTLESLKEAIEEIRPLAFPYQTAVVSPWLSDESLRRLEELKKLATVETQTFRLDALRIEVKEWVPTNLLLLIGKDRMTVLNLATGEAFEYEGKGVMP